MYSLPKWTKIDDIDLMMKSGVCCYREYSPSTSQLIAGGFTKYKKAGVKGVAYDTPRSPVKAWALNLAQPNLSSVFGTLKKLGHWSASNPLAGLPTFKIAEGELAFLTTDEIKRLLDACADSQSPSLLMTAKICLATGARWSEAENFQSHQLSKYRITYTKTKGKKNRTVPISQVLYNELPKNRGKLFTPCRKTFERAVKRAGIDLPEVQCTHVLRHTFASHFMMNGGNILVLNEILGHSDIKMTIIYAHFSPELLEDAITKNPIRNLEY